jgi:hypothetical protein
MSDTVILVLQRGWVLVGKYRKDGVYDTLTEGKVVRRWGTTQGLGEIAKNGPLETTVLDPMPYGARAHELAVVMIVPCNPEAWSGVF